MAAQGAAAAGGGTNVGVILDLVALLVVGGVILVTGNGMNNAMLGMFRTTSTRRVPSGY
jgi:hypothetical protein